jgi:hypothetical protein
MSDDGKKLSKASDDPLSANRDPNKKEWVKFEEDDDSAPTLPDRKVNSLTLSIDHHEPRAVACNFDHES